MCAEVIAGSLGLDMFKVDLSSVVSRWVVKQKKISKKSSMRQREAEPSFCLMKLIPFRVAW